VTGHTGFKGGWLVTWLLEMGARVSGYALAPDTKPSYFALCSLDRRVDSMIGDVRDGAKVKDAFAASRPEIVLHLAAQPLVRRSYRDPTETFATNVMGTVNVLEAVRATPSVRAVVIITSDKCYQNREWVWAYREDDPLAGHDPYSASKACAEAVATAYRRSFFEVRNSQVAIATARAGNVIGGGDWAEDRLVPDAIRALQCNESLLVRNPNSIRPWQHVLEPLVGYLMLAQRLYQEGRKWACAWNFGPCDEESITVAELAELIIREWGAGSWQAASLTDPPHEAGYLKLDCSKARALLGWRAVLTLAEAVGLTVEWYREAVSEDGAQMFGMSSRQIQSYESLLAGRAGHRS